MVFNYQVKWAEQQHIKYRVKRDAIDQSLFGPHNSPNDPRWSDLWYLVSFN